MESDRLQKLMELLKQYGIQVTAEQAEELLARSNSTGDGLAADNSKEPDTIPYKFIRGYKVFVRYKPITEEEMKMKQAMIARIIANAIPRFNK